MIEQPVVLVSSRVPIAGIKRLQKKKEKDPAEETVLMGHGV
jgi:hypothetical protein